MARNIYIVTQLYFYNTLANKQLAKKEQQITCLLPTFKVVFFLYKFNASFIKYLINVWDPA